MRVLVVDESAEQAEMLGAALLHAGYEVTASLSSPLALLKTIERVQPDVILIDIASPSRDVLEHLGMMSRPTPRPVRAGVSAYVVHGISAEKIEPIVNAAIARFEELQALRGQLAEANLKLVERKLIERAKGMLMKSRNLSEEAAYATLRKAAMDRNLKISEVAQRIVDAADLLGT